MRLQHHSLGLGAFLTYANFFDLSVPFGALFATCITLMIVPALYTIVEDWFGSDPTAQDMAEPEIV